MIKELEIDDPIGKKYEDFIKRQKEKLFGKPKMKYADPDPLDGVLTFYTKDELINIPVKSTDTVEIIQEKINKAIAEHKIEKRHENTSPNVIFDSKHKQL
jgi:hypothetical protein